jgi:hypothetical protein
MQKAQKDSYADHHNNCWLGNFAFSTTRHDPLDLKDRAKNNNSTVSFVLCRRSSVIDAVCGTPVLVCRAVGSNQQAL